MKQNQMLQKKVLQCIRNDNDIKNKTKAEVVKEEMYQFLKDRNEILEQINSKLEKDVETLQEEVETLKKRNKQCRKKKEDTK